VPLYVYQCQDCEHKFEVRHSMNYDDQVCVSCQSKNIFKIPSINVINNNKTVGQPRAGKVVDKYISDTKEDIKREKKKLSSREL